MGQMQVENQLELFKRDNMRKGKTERSSILHKILNRNKIGLTDEGWNFMELCRHQSHYEIAKKYGMTRQAIWSAQVRAEKAIHRGYQNWLKGNRNGPKL